VFDKTKLNSDVIIVAQSAISELQLHSTVNTLWVDIHSDKIRPPYSQHEDLNIRTDTLAKHAQIELPTDMKPQHDLLHFPEKQILIVISQKKVTSRLPLHISNMIHGPPLRLYMMQQEGWSPDTLDTIAWNSFAITFNKLTPAQKNIMTKTIFIFWCTNAHHRSERGQEKGCCFYRAGDEDWQHVINCIGTGAILYRTGS
jgi:hypothetical protein